MVALKKSWLTMAENYYQTALMLHGKRTFNDATRFWAYESATAHLKAVLHQRKMRFKNTDELRRVFKLVRRIDDQWTMLEPQLKAMVGLEVLYPGIRSTRLESRQAVELANQVRLLARKCLRKRQFPVRRPSPGLSRREKRTAAR